MKRIILICLLIVNSQLISYSQTFNPSFSDMINGMVRPSGPYGPSYNSSNNNQIYEYIDIKINEIENIHNKSDQELKDIRNIIKDIRNIIKVKEIQLTVIENDFKNLQKYFLIFCVITFFVIFYLVRFMNSNFKKLKLYQNFDKKNIEFIN